MVSKHLTVGTPDPITFPPEETGKILLHCFVPIEHGAVREGDPFNNLSR